MDARDTAKECGPKKQPWQYKNIGKAEACAGTEWEV